MHKFLIKIFATLLAAGGLFTWVHADASFLASAAALGMDDSDAWLAANSQNPKPFNLLEAADADLLRVDLPWNEVGISAGVFGWAYKDENGYIDYAQLLSRLEKRSIQPVFVLDGGPAFLANAYPQQPVSRPELLAAWQNYVLAAVQQFGGQVSFWQIGGRVNDPASWGRVVFPSANDAIASPDPELYAEMLKTAFAVIKSAQSSDTVILGGLALGGDCAFHPIAYLQALKDLDAWYAFDVITIELPALSGSPETAQPDTCAYPPIQTTGMPLADALRAINDFADSAGVKPIWVHNLIINNDLLKADAAGRNTLPEVVEADYLTRASALLMANGGADKVFWHYTPLSGIPGAVALQSFANLNRTIGGAREISARNLPGTDLQVARFRGSGRLVALAWRTSGGDTALAAAIPGFEGYDLHAWSADAAAMKKKSGVELKVDTGGNTALMVSERPVIISGKPVEVKDSINQLISDNAAQAKNGLKAKFASFVQAQKAKAADKVAAWVDEQQQSLMQTLKDSFNQWLRNSLGLAKG